MSELDRGTGRAGRRGKRFLSPSRKYEIWPQLVRQDATIAEAAAAQHVDRSTIMRIRTVANEGALAPLAASKPGVAARERDYELLHRGQRLNHPLAAFAEERGEPSAEAADAVLQGGAIDQPSTSASAWTAAGPTASVRPASEVGPVRGAASKRL